jgi:membrane-associated phospholipid phosphatase
VYKAGEEELAYSKPAFWGTVANGPKDFGTSIGNSFSKKNLPWLAAITASTLVLIEYDEHINSNTRRLGEKLNISAKDKTRPFLKVGKIPVLRGPTDLGSAMYFLGDGWVSIGLCAYFEAYGFIRDDWRALATGHQLVEGLLVTGFTTQVLKRSTGRETPSAATAPRGVWRFFPSFGEFQSHRTRYDAFPSGHLATGMMAVTVMSENYPEKKLIKPIGYFLLGALGFQMVNNGVHWASDYPLGLGIGYAVGKAITANAGNRTRKTASSLNLYPSLIPGRPVGLNLAYRF